MYLECFKARENGEGKLESLDHISNNISDNSALRRISMKKKKKNHTILVTGNAGPRKSSKSSSQKQWRNGKGAQETVGAFTAALSPAKRRGCEPVTSAATLVREFTLSFDQQGVWYRKPPKACAIG